MSEIKLTPRQRMIADIANYYMVPTFEKTRAGEKIMNERIKAASEWAGKHLSNKSNEELKDFKECMYVGRGEYGKGIYPNLKEFDQAYDLAFPVDFRPRMQEEDLPQIEDLRPQIDYDSTKDIEPAEYDLLSYLKDEQEWGPGLPGSDKLHKKYGFKGCQAANEWIGEQSIKKGIKHKQIPDVDWVNVYFEEKKEMYNGKRKHKN